MMIPNLENSKIIEINKSLISELAKNKRLKKEKKNKKNNTEYFSKYSK